eukprot:662662-Amphidinium_carterae.1
MQLTLFDLHGRTKIRRERQQTAGVNFGTQGASRKTIHTVRMCRQRQVLRPAAAINPHPPPNN